MPEETTPEEIAEWKAALRKSVSDFVPAEFDRKVAIRAGQLRHTFGNDVSKLGVPPNAKPDQLVEVTVASIWELTAE